MPDLLSLVQQPVPMSRDATGSLAGGQLCPLPLQVTGHLVRPHHVVTSAAEVVDPGSSRVRVSLYSYQVTLRDVWGWLAQHGRTCWCSMSPETILAAGVHFWSSEHEPRVALVSDGAARTVIQDSVTSVWKCWGWPTGWFWTLPSLTLRHRPTPPLVSLATVLRDGWACSGDEAWQARHLQPVVKPGAVFPKESHSGIAHRNRPGAGPTLPDTAKATGSIALAVTFLTVLVSQTASCTHLSTNGDLR